MNVLVLNGSPKGKYSITMQITLYLEKKFTGHSFSFINVGQQIKTLEKDFSNVYEAIDDADLIVFSYPVYIFIAPSQLHRFIELFGTLISSQRLKSKIRNRMNEGMIAPYKKIINKEGS